MLSVGNPPAKPTAVRFSLLGETNEMGFPSGLPLDNNDSPYSTYICRNYTLFVYLRMTLQGFHYGGYAVYEIIKTHY